MAFLVLNRLLFGFCGVVSALLLRKVAKGPELKLCRMSKKSDQTDGRYGFLNFF